MSESATGSPPEKTPKMSDNNDSKPPKGGLIGVSNFKEMVNHPMYIDKTSFIKYFIEEHSHTLITAPRRFGKSSLLSSMEHFLKIELNAEGIPVGPDRGENKKLFNNTCIFIDDKEFFDQHFGSHPVLRINFNFLDKFENYEQFLIAYKSFLRVHYKLNRYVLKNDILDEDDKTRFKNIVEKNLTEETDLKMALRDLATWINEYFIDLKLRGGKDFEFIHKKVYLLIDEMDSPIHEMMHSKVNSEDSTKILGFMNKVFLFLLKQEVGDPVKKSLSFGAHYVSGILSNVSNHVVRYGFQKTNLFADYLGFTEKDVSRFVKDKEFEEMKNWYNGYQVEITESQTVNIYCPESVLRYVVERKLKRYWSMNVVKTFKRILNTEEILLKLNSLLDDEKVIMKPIDKYTIEDFSCLKSFLERGAADSSIVDLWLQYMQEDGLFSFVELKDGQEGDTKGILIIPNKEVRFAFQQEFYENEVFSKWKNESGLRENVKQSYEKVVSEHNRLSFENLAESLRESFTKHKTYHQWNMQYYTKIVLEQYCRNVEVDCEKRLLLEEKKGIDLYAVFGDTLLIEEMKSSSAPTKETSVVALEQIFSRHYYTFASQVGGKKKYILMGLRLDRTHFKVKVTISYLVCDSFEEMEKIKANMKEDKFDKSVEVTTVFSEAGLKVMP